MIARRRDAPSDPATASEPGSWLRRLGARDAALLPKILASFVAILTLASVITLLLETQLTRSQLQSAGLSIVAEAGNALDERITTEATRTTRLMSSVVQGLFGVVDAEDADAAAAELTRRTLSTVRLSDPQLELVGVIDVATGTASDEGFPTRDAFADIDPADAEAVARSGGATQRVVPLRSGAWAVGHVLPTSHLDTPRLLVAGYPLNDAALRRWERQTGVAAIEVVVDGVVVASSDPDRALDDTTPLGEWERSRVTQRLENGDLVRYVTIGGDRPWDTPAAIGLIEGDPLETLGGGLTRTRWLMAALLLGVAATLAYVGAQVLTRPVRRLTETATAIAAGDLDRRFDVGTRDELGRLGESLERMRRALRAQLLVIGRQADALQEAARRIVGVQDEERQRVAQDLHDGIQQQLVVLRMQVGVARAQLSDDPATLDEVTLSLATSIDRLLDQLRSTGQQLFPSILRDRGLGPALFSLASRTDVPLDVVLRPDPLPRLDPETEINAYFLLSEAVLNALKHAEATRVSVRIVHEGGQLRVVAEDDGVGFVMGAQERRGGLVHMRDRVNALRGTLTVASRPGSGTRVEALFPLPGAQQPEAGTSSHVRAARSVARALEEEEHGGDAAVEVEVLRQAELAEDGVGVFLDGTLRDGQLPGDGRVPPP
ncbi:MAG: HAMP domain-containing protein [Nitriliruptoraceae bacterium]|nr:HAMP domain-containing protein [Nitriliruptoraceae bacterium]